MIYLLISIGVIVLDQATKMMIRQMPPDGEYRIIGNLLRIVHVENSGAAFGMFEGNTRFLLILPAIIIVAAVFYILRASGEGMTGKLEKISLTLIVSGGIGNMIDRFIYGQVTDMISFSFFPPVFNVADIAVTCGCGLLILSLLTDGRFDSTPDEKKKE